MALLLPGRESIWKSDVLLGGAQQDGKFSTSHKQIALPKRRLNIKLYSNNHIEHKLIYYYY